MVLAVLAGGLLVLRDSGDGGASPSAAEPQVAPPGALPAETPEPSASGPLATGLSERNPLLLTADRVDPALEPWRARLSELRPDYYRLEIDWAQLQPSPDRPADLAKPMDGCVRGIAPCAPHAGIRDILRAVRSQQDASGGWEVIVSMYGVPDWAARPAGGCERPDIEPRSRPITDRGLDGYRALIRQLAALAREERVELRWWSPWNEANQQFFVSPQRERCDAASPSLAPRLYARVVRAAREAIPAGAELVLGELAGVGNPSPRVTGIREFVDALPDDVACAGAFWTQHAYVERVTDEGPVGELKRALDARPCTRGKEIWITETGVGGAHAGQARATDPDTLAAGCRALNRQLRRWSADDRIGAAFQFSFREDPAFRVGVVDTGLTRTYPAFDVWKAWASGAPATRDVCG